MPAAPAFADALLAVPGSLYSREGSLYFPAGEPYARYFPGSRSRGALARLRALGFRVTRRRCGTYRVALP